MSFDISLVVLPIGAGDKKSATGLCLLGCLEIPTASGRETRMQLSQRDVAYIILGIGVLSVMGVIYEYFVWRFVRSNGITIMHE